MFIPSLKHRKDPKRLYSYREPESKSCRAELQQSLGWSITAIVQHTESLHRRGRLVPIPGKTMGNGIQMSTDVMLLMDKNEQHSATKMHVGFSSLWWTKYCFYMKDT